jgi:nicotinamidase-related amidase/alkylated DNA repair dioxygenase AlkB
MSVPGASALLVVDPQNDFLSDGGVFAKRHVETAQLAHAIAWSVAAARQQGRLVVWVTSSYGESGTPGDESLRGQTHIGAPCCVRGSWGAEVIAPLRALFEGGDLRLEKRWYSAFRETGLHERLQAAGVKRVILCGVATNVCVLATAREARQLGYEVEVLADATAAGTASKHARALDEIEKLGGQRREWISLLAEGEGPVAIGGLGAGDTTLWCGALRACFAAGASYEALEREVRWSTMFHRGGEVPRLVAIQGTRGPGGVEPLYRHPVDGQPDLADWTPVVDQLRRVTEERIGHPLNHCLIQLYRHGRDWISEHSDKTLDLERPSFIVNVSLGRTRTMVLRPKKAGEEGKEARQKTAGDEGPEARQKKAGDEGPEAKQKIPLPHGSILVMGLETNRALYHAIRQEGARDEDGPRISLTFRHIGTMLEPSTGAVWGIGSPVSTQAEARVRAASRAALDPAERRLQERAESERMLHLFRDENIDPTFDVARYRPGFEVIDLRALNEPAAVEGHPAKEAP